MQTLHQVIKRWLTANKPHPGEPTRPLSLREMRDHYLLDTTRPPTAPVPFGYRMGWLALRTTNQEAVIHGLRLTNSQEIAWGAGMLVQERSWEADRGEVQSFLTDRIPEIHHWMLAREGVLLRSFVCDGERGIIWSDYGALTSVERGFDWASLSDLRWFPNEEDVLRVAGAWSLNPATLDTIDLAERKGTTVLAQVPREALLDRYFLLAPPPPTAILDPTSTWELSLPTDGVTS